jgi:hypothetical protein
MTFVLFAPFDRKRLEVAIVDVAAVVIVAMVLPHVRREPLLYPTTHVAHGWDCSA